MTNSNVVQSDRPSLTFTSDEELRLAIRDVCKRYDARYWRELDASLAYPEDFVSELTQLGWLAILIPEEYGGSGLGLSEASIVVQEINHSGGNAAACHAQMYMMNVILRYGTQGQKQRYLPEIASGELRLQASAGTEPDAGSDKTRVATTSRRQSNGDYVVNGRKVFISRVKHSDLMLLLARTSPYDPAQPSAGLSMFLIDLRDTGDKIQVRPIETMINHETNELVFDNLVLPGDSRIGEEGQAYEYLLNGMSAERILVAAECIGDGWWFIGRSVEYAKSRIVFDRPIGQNQGIQFPIAEAYTAVEAAHLAHVRAAEIFDEGKESLREASIAKLLATRASWLAANVCMDTHGGYGFSKEYDIERKFRETRLFTVAPIGNNLILDYLATDVLGLPKSY